jgi:hypothetical protein
MITLSMPKARAPSVPGRICRWYLARVDIQVLRGSMEMIWLPRFMQSTTQCPKKPSEQVGGGF